MFIHSEQGAGNGLLSNFLRQMFQRSKGVEFAFPISTTLCSMGKLHTQLSVSASRYGVTTSVDKEELRVSSVWTHIRPWTQSHNILLTELERGI